MTSDERTIRDAWERAQRLHAERPVLDSLAPTFTCEMHLTPAMVELARDLQARGKSRSAIRLALAEHLIEAVPRDPEAREGYLAYWKRAGVTAASCTVYDAGPPSRAWEETLAELARSTRLLQGLGDAFTVGGSAADVLRAHREGHHTVIYNLQNGEPIGDDFGRLDLLYKQGVRVIQMTYNLRNRFGDGCVERRDGGLSRFGLSMIETLNRRRMLIDLSHSSDQTALDAIAASQAPVAFTHTSARALSRHPRGKTDEALRASSARVSSQARLGGPAS